MPNARVLWNGMLALFIHLQKTSSCWNTGISLPCTCTLFWPTSDHSTFHETSWDFSWPSSFSHQTPGVNSVFHSCKRVSMARFSSKTHYWSFHSLCVLTHSFHRYASTQSTSKSLATGDWSVSVLREWWIDDGELLAACELFWNIVSPVFSPRIKWYWRWVLVWLSWNVEIIWNI